MSRLQNYLNKNNDISRLIMVSEFIEMDINRLDEGFSDIKRQLSGLLPKIGLGMDFKEGLIHQLSRASIHMSKFVWHIFRYHITGNQESKEKIVELSQTKISREQFMDFLFKMDILTLSLFTAPLKMVDALLGWSIHPVVKNKTKDVMERGKQAIKQLMDVAKAVPEKLGKKLETNIKRIENLLRVNRNEI